MSTRTPCQGCGHTHDDWGCDYVWDNPDVRTWITRGRYIFCGCRVLPTQGTLL